MRMGMLRVRIPYLTVIFAIPQVNIPADGTGATKTCPPMEAAQSIKPEGNKQHAMSVYNIISLLIPLPPSSRYKHESPREESDCSALHFNDLL